MTHRRNSSLVAAVVLAGLWLAVTAPTGQAARDSVRGTASHFGADPPYPLIQVRIKARADATGAHARGKLVSDMTNATTEGRYKGRVTCLSLFGSPFGNEATIGIEIVKARNPAFVGKGQLWSVVDNARSGEPDRIAGYPLTESPPNVCPQLFFNVPIASGDYVVRDM